MRRTNSTLAKAAFATVLGILSVPFVGSTEARAQVDQPFPPYNPYPPLPGSVPPTVLPPNLQSELLRVRGEVQTIFGRYFAEWQALTPMPTYAGNPPILVPNGYEAQRILGGLLNFDESISAFQNTACASCHMPYAAFGGPIPSENLTTAAYVGSFRDRAAKRSPQRYTYSHTFPVLNYDNTQQPVLRRKLLGWACDRNEAAGSRRRTGAGPSGRSDGNGFADTACIAFRLPRHRTDSCLSWCGASTSTSVSRPTLPGSAPSQMGQGGSAGSATPIALSPTDRTKATNIYDHWGQSLSFLERSVDVSPFNSKFDAFLAGNRTR